MRKKSKPKSKNKIYSTGKVKSKNRLSEANAIIKTGKASEFFASIKAVMKSADNNQSIKKSHTLVFEDPLEMLRLLSAAKIKLIRVIREHPDSISNLAKATKRKRTAVNRDINELERFGIVKTHNEINPGHGLHRVVELISDDLKLEVKI